MPLLFLSCNWPHAGLASPASAAMGLEDVERIPPHLRGSATGGFAAFQDLAYGLTGR